MILLNNYSPRKFAGAEFASAANDGVIRLWMISGKQVGELHGHEAYIYSLASTPTGELVSSGEDRTVRVWKGQECIQTITHPAISVWTVAVCPENGDIVSGASDNVVRVFSRDSERVADAETTKNFEDSVKESSIPQQQLGEVNKEKLPGPEFLTQKAGTKEGQVQMIRELNGSVTAHTWSTSKFLIFLDDQKGGPSFLDFAVRLSDFGLFGLSELATCNTVAPTSIYCASSFI